MIKHLKEVFEQLLKEDEDLEVVQKFVPQMPELARIFEAVKASEQDSSAKEKEKDYSYYTGVSGKDETRYYISHVHSVGMLIRKLHLWRLELQFIEGYEVYYKLYSAKDLSDKLIPYLITCIKQSAHDVSLKAIEILVKFIRLHHLSSYSKDLLKLLNEDFYLATSFKHRISFIRIYVELAKAFSRNFLKMNLLHQAFSIASDSVAQVRRQYTHHLAGIRKSIHPEDNENTQKFTDILNRLIIDPDKEVSDVKFYSRRL